MPTHLFNQSCSPEALHVATKGLVIGIHLNRLNLTVDLQQQQQQQQEQEQENTFYLTH